jgi:hypothetical protein
MRSWENRPDTFVCDEPLYAHYLLATGADHPGREEVIAAHETDWRKVASWLTGPVPGGKAVFYQKHMAHHLLPGIDRGWMEALTHVFLIRHPRDVIVSYLKKNPHLGIRDTGFPQQAALFDWARGLSGRTPPVVDAADILADPRRALSLLCAAVGLPFLDTMLAWRQGPRPTDGIWAKHWYAEVERATGFAAPAPRDEPVPRGFEALLAECMELYEPLHSHRLR